MTTIKEILEINLDEDIKEVIDLEDQAEEEIIYELNHYIVTQNLANHFASFVNEFTSNKKETGVWISGFFGSGKSYFGKILGYLIANKTIAGTTVIDRFLPKLTGLDNELLIRNDIYKLQTINTRVVLLDIAKQDTKIGLAYTLFNNFLKSLSFLPNIYGFIEYSLFLNNEYDEFLNKVREANSREWKDIRKNILSIETGIKKALIGWKYSESEYNNTIGLLHSTISHFDSEKLKEQLSLYLEKNRDEKIVFLFDEASEAISQKKISLLDLEGLSESLSDSSLQRKVWTIAIAQEKLDDVINNANIDKALLNKVTDRFRTKIHLESTDVDIIIRQRLLKKKDSCKKQLIDYFNINEGSITDLTSLNSSSLSKTDNAEDFFAYYPLFKHQTVILQNFLFGTKGLASTKIAARGMIVTSFDVLKNKLKDKTLFETATLSAFCEEAQQTPPARLISRYDSASIILKNEKIPIDGRALLETIHFLTEAENVPVTIDNITKSFISDPANYFTVLEVVKSALELLTNSKILLYSEYKYKITSDIEQRLIDEMSEYRVEVYNKRKFITDLLKKSDIITYISKIIDEGNPYNFHIVSDQDEDIIPSTNKQLKISIHNIYGVENKSEKVNQVKNDTQNDKEKISLIPDIESFGDLDKTITDIKRISYLEEKYTNTQNDEYKVVKDFMSIKAEKEKHLVGLIAKAYSGSSLVYLFNTYNLDNATFKNIVNDQQRQLIKNIYTKRLKSQLSDDIALKIIKETKPEKLSGYFNGDDFKFFDNSGNFIGDNLKVVEEIIVKIQNIHVDGKTLEQDLLLPPTGYSFGTISTTIAVLFRAGRLIAKFSGSDKFAYTDNGVDEIFSNSKNFQKASFKTISRKLSQQQKTDIVDNLRVLDYKEHTGQSIDYNKNDFELVTATKTLAEKFIGKVDTFKKTVNDFDKLFSYLTESKDKLQEFSGNISDTNYIDKADYFLSNLSDYGSEIAKIDKAEKFIGKNLDKFHSFQIFISQVESEYSKAGLNPSDFKQNKKLFEETIGQNIIDKWSELQNIAQKIKDEYYSLMILANTQMSENHIVLKHKADELITLINKYPPVPNQDNLSKAELIKSYADKRINSDVKIEYDIFCKNCNFSLSEMKTFIQLMSTKEAELLLIENNIIKDIPKPKPDPIPGKPLPDPDPTYKPQTIKTKIPSSKMSVKSFKEWLLSQFKSLAAANDNDEIEIEK